MIEKSDSNTNLGGDGGGIETTVQDKLDTILSEVTACTNKSALQYKKLSDSCFFWASLLLHISILASAMTVKNLDIVIEFAGAIGCSS